MLELNLEKRADAIIFIGGEGKKLTGGKTAFTVLVGVSLTELEAPFADGLVREATLRMANISSTSRKLRVKRESITRRNGW